MDYTEYTFTISPVDPWRDVLVSHLEMYPFETFQDTEGGMQAYIAVENDSEDLLNDIDLSFFNGVSIQWTRKFIKGENWNKNWESHFDPIVIGNQCYIRASFHEAKPDFPFEIVIDPKMAFGTGHHQTTHMMAEWVLEDNWEGKRVLDMGCGTLVLGILAHMKKAKEVVGIDIDEWAYDNAKVNCEANNINDIEALCGDAEILSKWQDNYFDCILANINRNILLNDMDKYTRVLKSSGDLYLSGFYEADIPVLEELGTKLGFQFIGVKKMADWVSLHWKKK